MSDPRSTRFHPSLVPAFDNPEDIVRNASTATNNSFHTAAVEPVAENRTPSPQDGDFETMAIITDSTAIEREEPTTGSSVAGGNQSDENDNGNDKDREKKIEEILEKQPFLRARDMAPLLRRYTEIDLRGEIERLVGETLQVKSMHFNDDLRHDFVEAVKYAMKVLILDDQFIADQMTITDKFVKSVTDAVLSKGTLMTSIAAHVRRTLADEFGKLEMDVMAAQNWKAHAAEDTTRDAKEERKTKSTKYSPPDDSDGSKSDTDTDWAADSSTSSKHTSADENPRLYKLGC